MMHTSIHNETEAIKETIALNTIKVATQWLCDRGHPELAAQMLDEFLEAEEE